MNRTVLIAGAVVLLSNGVALFHAARNRWGEPETVLELSERDLRLNWVSRGNSHRFVTFNWTNPQPNWLDQDRMAALGFDVSNPAPYRAQLLRAAYVALEIDGLKTHPDTPRLVTIDADRSPVRLRARHPDSSKVIILRATIRAYPEGTRVRGSVSAIVPSNISLPPGMADGIQPWQTPAPRFAMRIAVGRNYEPYIAGFRTLPAP